MTIEQFNEDKKGYFKAVENGVEAGRMTYTWAGPKVFIIDHTEVNPDFSGQGVGKKLVMEAVQFAREQEVKIMPLYPYAMSVFKKTEEIRDVLR